MVAWNGMPMIEAGIDTVVAQAGSQFFNPGLMWFVIPRVRDEGCAMTWHFRLADGVYHQFLMSRRVFI
jgi:hypothetical protein